MTFPTHALGGATAIALLDTVIPSFTADKIDFIIGITAAIIPDIDYSRSFIGRVLYPLSCTIESHVGHRTASHSFLIALVFSTITGWILSLFLSTSLLQSTVVVFAGYSSHILLDWFTKEGAQSYWPAHVWCILPKNRSWRIKTGSSGEFIFITILLSFFAITFQPTREATAIWFRSSFIQEKTYELERFNLKKLQATNGFTLYEIDSLYKNNIITLKEKKEMLYELENISINEHITRRMYGLPDTNSNK